MAELQQQLQQAHVALDEAGSVFSGCMKVNAMLRETLGVADGIITELQQHDSSTAVGLQAVTATHAAEMDATAAWYIKHDDEDRAALVMAPGSLQAEYDRFCD